MGRIIITGLCDGWSRRPHAITGETITIEGMRLCAECLAEFRRDNMSLKTTGLPEK